MLRADVRLARGSFVLDVELRVGDGERVAIVGPSGAGKSTLLRAIAGLVEGVEGRIDTRGLDGESETWLDGDRDVDVAPERRGIGFVFQDYALFPTMTAWQNVAYGIAGSRAERRSTARELLARFGMDDRAEAKPASLSGGERQRVALARALARGPRLLLLDEPLSALDARTRVAASGELAGVLAASGVPAIMVTHDFREAALLADRILVLDEGRVVQGGTAAELAASPASGLVADLAGAVVLRGQAEPGPDGLTAVELDGGGRILSTDEARGAVAASVFPWEVTIDDPGHVADGSAMNHLRGAVTTVTEFGNRARVGLATPQPVVAEVTFASIERLHLSVGDEATASWKATATRLVPR